jgi:hypothetical protein
MRSSRQIVAVIMLLVLVLQGGGVFWCGLYAGSKAIQTLHTTRTAGVLAAIRQLNKSTGTCKPCKAIAAAKGKTDEHRSSTPSALSQLESLVFSHEERAFRFLIGFSENDYRSPRLSAWHTRADRPATPPPRTA